jgi:hypothetical protein
MKMRYEDKQIDSIFRVSPYQEQQFTRLKKRIPDITMPKPDETVQAAPPTIPAEEPAPAPEQGGAEVPTENDAPMDAAPEDTGEDTPPAEADEKVEAQPGLGKSDQIKNKKELKKKEEFSNYDVQEFIHVIETFVNVEINNLESNILKKVQVMTHNFPQDARVEIFSKLNDYFDEKVDFLKRSLMRMMEKITRNI